MKTSPFSDLCGLLVTDSEGSREWLGGTCFMSWKIRQKVIDFPMTYPRNAPPSEWDGWQGEGAHHLQTPCSNPSPCPPPRCGDHLLSPSLSLAVSVALPLSHLCLCRAAAAQKTEGPAFTSEHISHQMSPFAASPSNIQADNAPCILNIWLTPVSTRGLGEDGDFYKCECYTSKLYVHSDTYRSSTYTRVEAVLEGWKSNTSLGYKQMRSKANEIKFKISDLAQTFIWLSQNINRHLTLSIHPFFHI